MLTCNFLLSRYTSRSHSSSLEVFRFTSPIHDYHRLPCVAGCNNLSTQFYAVILNSSQIPRCAAFLKDGHPPRRFQARSRTKIQARSTGLQISRLVLHAFCDVVVLAKSTMSSSICYSGCLGSSLGSNLGSISGRYLRFSLILYARCL